MTRRPLEPPRLLAIGDRRSLPAGTDYPAWLRSVAEAGVDAVQVREKDLDDRALFALVRTARSVLPPRVRLLVNGRADLALAAGADGVHLPAAGLPAPPLRALAHRLGRRLLIGRSTHRRSEVAAAHDEGVDYVTFGPVFPTPSKERYGPPPGLEGLREACGVGVPVLALGGVDAERLQAVARAGAHGAAGIRGFQDPAGRESMVAAATVFAPGACDGAAR